MTKLIITDKNIHQKVKEFYKNKKSIKKVVNYIFLIGIQVK